MNSAMCKSLKHGVYLLLALEHVKNFRRSFSSLYSHLFTQYKHLAFSQIAKTNSLPQQFHKLIFTSARWQVAKLDGKVIVISQ